MQVRDSEKAAIIRRYLWVQISVHFLLTSHSLQTKSTVLATNLLQKNITNLITVVVIINTISEIF